MAHRERTARRQGPPRRSKLNPDRDLLLGLVEHTPDMTIVKMQRLVGKNFRGKIIAMKHRPIE